MLKVNLELNMIDEENDLYNPVILVTEDNSDDVCPIILPENSLRVVAVETSKAFEKAILSNYKTVEEVAKALYD